MIISALKYAGKLFIHIGPTFLWQNYSVNIYLIHVEFGTVKDIFMVNISIVLIFLFFCIFGEKMTPQNGNKFYFIFFYFRTFIWL